MPYIKATAVMLVLVGLGVLAWIIPNGFAILIGGGCLLTLAFFFFLMLVEGFRDGFDFDDH